MVLAGANFRFLLAFLEDINQNQEQKRNPKKKWTGSDWRAGGPNAPKSRRPLRLHTDSSNLAGLEPRLHSMRV